MALIELNAGPLTMAFDSDNAFLRYVRLDDHEIVRGVFAAVRDCNWDTIPFSIDPLQIEQTANSFCIAFVANSLQPEISFVWNGRILGNSEGLIQYGFRGIVNEPFRRNRIGLCVLHPSSACAGKPCRVDHVDGSMTLAPFPKFISPHQPFKSIRSIAQPIGHNLQVKVTMTGDTFEMEDQRNWTDASFKTYSTPLEIAFPVSVEKGESIEQSVTIELIRNRSRSVQSTKSNSRRSRKPQRMEIDWGEPVSRPKIGFQLPPGQPTPGKRVLDLLLAMTPDHIRCDLWLTQDNWHTELMRGIAFAHAIQSKLELAIFVDSVASSSWKECLASIEQCRDRVSRVLLFHPMSKTTPSELVEPARQSIKSVAPNVPIVVGTNAYFAELNRWRPTWIPDTKVCYSINPQVHAFDNLSVSETLSAQRETVDTAVKLFDCDVVISPITLRPRFNPNATSFLDPETQLQAAVDPRQCTGFGAAWTVGVFSNLLTHPRVHSATLYEAFGQRGVIGSDCQSFPMTSPIEILLQCKSLFKVESTSPLEVVAVGTDSPNGVRHVLFGNLSDRAHTVWFRTPTGAERQRSIAAESVEIVVMEENIDA